MKKLTTITLLIIAGIIAATGLILGAFLEVLEAIIGLLIWFGIIGVGWFLLKRSKT